MPTPPIPPPPSFSSAPSIPTAPAFASAPASTSDRKDRPDRDKESDRRRERLRKEQRYSPTRHSRKRSRSPNRSSHSKRSRHSESKSKKEDAKSSSHQRSRNIAVDGGKIFFIDKKGDANAFFYGEVDRYKVPSYRRAGGGRVLGYPRYMKIDLASAKAGKVLLLVDTRKEKRIQRYMDLRYTWKENDKSYKRVNLLRNQGGNEHANGETPDFVPVEDGIRNVERTDAGPLVESLDADEVDYRSIDTPKKPQMEEEPLEEEDNVGESFDEYVKRRTIEFNRQLDEDPHNPHLWIQFVTFQDVAAAGLNTGVGKGTTVKSKATKASLNEVKLSIFEKALEKNPGSEVLLLSYMRCAVDIWDTKTILTKWDSILRENTNSISLWTEYVNYRQTSFSSFTFQQCLQVFEECLAGLRNIIRRLENDKSRDTYAEREDAESIMIYVFLRCCLFLKQSGYVERAFGCFQAIIEMNLFPPRIFTMANLQITFDEMLMEFEMFWDSEVPRFGEQGATGWQEFYRAKSNGESPDNIPEAYETGGNDEGIGFDEWVAVERRKDRSRRTPLRISNTQAEDIDEDPYVIVMFDDIRKLMFRLKTRQNLQHLMYTFFTFLNLPYIPPQISTNTPFTTDTFTHNYLAGSGLSQKFWPKKPQKNQRLITYVGGIPMEPEKQAGVADPFGIPSCSFPIGVDELFANPLTWFSCTPQLRLDSDTDISFIRNAFEQLLKISDDQHLQLCYLSFESNLSMKRGAKAAKNLLKEDRNNLSLWNAYAQHEKSHNKISEARKVYHTALSMYKNLQSADQANGPLLFRTLAELELDMDRPEVALNILVSMAEEVPRLEDDSIPSTTQILKARSFFAQKTSYLTTLAVTEADYSNAHQYFISHTLFEYLTQGIEAACQVFEDLWKYYTERGVERSIDNEMLLVAYARLLYRHNSKGGLFKASIMRDVLQQSLKLFPNNTVLLSLFMWNEARTKIENRVRQHINRALEHDPNYVLWEFAIYNELHHHVVYNANLVRSLFERAVECTRTRSSISLWKLYIEFEMREDNHERAKIIFYRAIRECPWAKDLYMIGFEALYHHMSEQELHQLLSTMMEKELRIRTVVDTFIDASDPSDQNA